VEFVLYSTVVGRHTVWRRAQDCLAWQTIIKTYIASASVMLMIMIVAINGPYTEGRVVNFGQ